MDAKLNFSLLEGNLNDSFISDVGRRSPPTRQFPPSLVMPTILGKIDEEANLPRIHLYSSSTEKADSSPTPSNPTKSNAAPTMQGNEDFAVMGLKQREKLMEGLRKENFELKLKAYFLEDTLEKTTPEWYEKAVHEITSLREQNTLYLSEITKIQSDYEKRWRLLEIEVADKHSKELHEWERKLNEAEDHIARMEEENDALSETVKVKSAEVHEALEQLDLHKMRVREKELKLEEVDRLNRELEAQRDEARFSADENVDQARQLRSECEGLRSELKKAKEEREKARADSARWKDRAREEKKNGSTEISKLQNEIEHVKSSIRATEQDRDSLKKRLADLERKLADSERYRTDLELEKEDLVREAERSNERLVKSTRRHEQEMARLQQRNGRLQDELNRAQRGMLSKNAAVSTVSMITTFAERLAEKSMKEIDALRIDVAAKESDINELNSSLQFLHSVLERIANIFRTSSAVADFRLVVPADHQTSERMRNVRAVEGCLGDLLVACSSGEVPVSIQHNLATMLSLLARSVMRTTSASNPGSPILSIRSTPKPGNQFHETASAAESSPGPLDPGRNADLNEHSRSRSQKPRSSMGAGGLGGVVMDETQRHKIKNGSGEAGDHSARAECKSENISHETALLRQKLDLSQLKLQKKSIECQELEDKLLDQTKEMVSLKEQQENLRVENQSLSASKESLIRANEQKCLRKDEKITSMKTELESKVKEIDSLKAEISGLQSQLSKLNSRISQLKPEAESLRLANAKHAAERAQLLDSQRRDVDNMATFLRSKVEEVELLLAREREQTSYLRRELEVRCKLMAELEGQLVDEQEGRVQDREDAQIARARFEAEAHKFIMDAEEKRRHVEETAEERVERAMDEAKSLIQEAETSAKMRIQEANESLRAIKEEMGIQKLALEQAIKDKEERLSVTQSLLEQVSKQYEEKCEEKTEEHTRYEQRELERNAELATILDRAEAEFKASGAAISDLETENRRLKVELDGAVKSKCEHKKGRQDAELQLTAFKNDLKTLKEENERLESKVSALESEREKQAKQCKALMQQLGTEQLSKLKALERTKELESRLVDLESNRRAEASVWEDEHKESAKNAQLLAESQQTIQLLRQELQKVAIEHQHALETNEIKYLQAKERFDNEVADELQRTIEEAERRERDATRKIEELAKALQEREAFISHISEQLDKAKEGAQRKESEVLQLRFQLEDSKRKVHVKELELQKMNTDLEAIRRESERIQLDLSEAQMEKNYHTSKLGERNSLLLMIARTLSETINDRDILEENSTENFGYVRDFVITNLKTLTKIRADVQAKFSKRENLLASVQSSWYAAFEEINGRLRSAESVVQNLHEGGREWADEKRSLLGQLETEKNAHERVRTQLANAEAELVDARNRTSNLTKDLERARTQLASTGVERDLAIQKSSESLKFELESLQELLRNSEQRLEHERRGAMSRVQELQQANRDLEMKVDVLTRKCKQLEEWRKMRPLVPSGVDSVDELKLYKVNEQLRTDLDEKLRGLDDAHLRLRDFQDENIKLVNKIAQLKKSLQRKKTEVSLALSFFEDFSTQKDKIEQYLFLQGETVRLQLQQSRSVFESPGKATCDTGISHTGSMDTEDLLNDDVRTAVSERPPTNVAWMKSQRPTIAIPLRVRSNDCPSKRADSRERRRMKGGVTFASALHDHEIFEDESHDYEMDGSDVGSTKHYAGRLAQASSPSLQF